MPTEKSVTNFVINKVPTKTIFNKMKEQGLINDDEIYLVEEDDNSYLSLTGGTLTGTLTTHGIILTSGVDFGSSLPSTAKSNQLFFQTASSNFVLDNVYPVGAVYIAMNNTDPGTLFGGTWQRINNYFLWGCDNGGTIGATGGEQTVALTMNQMPKHDGHLASGVMNPDGNPIGHGNFAGYIDKNVFTSYGSKGRGWSAFDGNEMHPASQNQGGGSLSEGQAEAHNNMPPYIQVAMWYRTA